MYLSRTLAEVIDLRSFSNLWFWIGLAIMWSSASHWVLGIPWDLIARGKRKGGATQDDVETLARVHVNRMLYIGEVSGIWMAGIYSAALAGFWVLGFHYGIHFFQAVFLLAFPMALVGLMSVRTAKKIDAAQASGIDLYRYLRNHRIWVQILGAISIFVTALWGMYQNLNASVLGN